jgi:NAD(P)-dependent dehydrogenase (short-subunit alcohol dehydrogenase family)
MMSSKGKRIAWVTGGGSGIGLAGAAALAGDGWSVTISGRRLDALEEAAKRIDDKTSAKVDILPLDVTRVDDVRAAARSILAAHGQIDLLVNKCRSQRAQAELERSRDRWLGPDRGCESERCSLRDPRRLAGDAGAPDG